MPDPTPKTRQSRTTTRAHAALIRSVLKPTILRDYLLWVAAEYGGGPIGWEDTIDNCTLANFIAHETKLKPGTSGRSESHLFSDSGDFAVYLDYIRVFNVGSAGCTKVALPVWAHEISTGTCWDDFDSTEITVRTLAEHFLNPANLKHGGSPRTFNLIFGKIAEALVA
jgi:hypothetical protein